MQGNESDYADRYENPRVVSRGESNAWQGTVRLQPTKAAWVLGMYTVAIVGGALTFSWPAFWLFLVFTAVTLCLGHSLGMHRRFIHNSYECPRWLEYLFVHFGVLVGLAGPMGMMRTHDMRDWAQRQAKCHDYFGHQQPFLKDGYWQLFCDIELHHPPRFRVEPRVRHDRVYQLMESTWMLQQLPWAVVFHLWGGWAFVAWGICVRVAVSVTGHWLIGYFAHNAGHRTWNVSGASIQGYNVAFAGLITMGESWHNNHHAFPGSALLGLEKGQVDPGWWVLRFLERAGLVWNIKLPADLPSRPELQRLPNEKSQGFT